MCDGVSIGIVFTLSNQIVLNKKVDRSRCSRIPSFSNKITDRWDSNIFQGNVNHKQLCNDLGSAHGYCIFVFPLVKYH